jgi:hypothetical protein
VTIRYQEEGARATGAQSIASRMCKRPHCARITRASWSYGARLTTRMTSSSFTRRYGWRSTAALAVLLASLAARGDPPLASAPLGGGTPGPIRQLFLDPALADARAVGSPLLSVRLETTNSWSVPALVARGGRVVAVQLDVEADALALSARLPWSALGGLPSGWRARVATTFGWRVTGFWGGFEDGGIESWHHLVGAYNFRRNFFPRDHVNLRLAEHGATAFDLGSSRIAPGDLVVGTQILLASGGASRVSGATAAEPGWGLSARVDLKAPTGALARAGGSGGADGGVAFLASVELAPWAVMHGMIFGTVVSPFASPVALQPRRFHAGADASLVLLAGGWSLAIEDRFLSPLLEAGWTVLDGGDDALFLSSPAAALFRAHNQITVGLRRGRFTLAFSEDFTPGPNPRGARTWFYSSNAPDVVLALTFVVPL